MFQRLTSVLFGDDVEEVRRVGPGEQDFSQKDEDEEWILVDYLGEFQNIHRHTQRKHT